MRKKPSLNAVQNASKPAPEETQPEMADTASAPSQPDPITATSTSTGTDPVEATYNAQSAGDVEDNAENKAETEAGDVVLTSKSVDEHSVELFIGEISAECVLNIKMTPDLIKNGKFVGSKSEKVKAALMQGKKHALSQLRQKAQSQGANLVSDVSVKNVVKSADAQKVSLVVKATGAAAKTEITEVIC